MWGFTSDRIVGPTKFPFSYPGTTTSRPSSASCYHKGSTQSSSVWRTGLLSTDLCTLLHATLHKAAHSLLCLRGYKGPKVSTRFHTTAHSQFLSWSYTDGWNDGAHQLQVLTFLHNFRQPFFGLSHKDGSGESHTALSSGSKRCSHQLCSTI